jgi:hypothetical protein
MNRQKQRELAFINELRGLLADFPVEEVHPFETPDALLQCSDRILGIEVVEYVRGQNQGLHGSMVRKRENDRQRVASIARRVFENRFQCNLIVYLLWNSNIELLPADVQELGRELGDLISQRLEEVPEAIHSPIAIEIGDDWESLLARSIVHVDVMRTNGSALWSAVEAGFIGTDASEIAALIEKKNDKASEYRRKCDELWLLIVADGSNISSNVDIDRHLMEHSFETVFDRVLFYRRFEYDVIELRIMRSS